MRSCERINRTCHPEQQRRISHCRRKLHLAKEIRARSFAAAQDDSEGLGMTGGACFCVAGADSVLWSLRFPKGTSRTMRQGCGAIHEVPPAGHRRLHKTEAAPAPFSSSFVGRRPMGTNLKSRSALGMEMNNQPSPPWGRGWPATALSPAVAGRVRGSSAPPFSWQPGFPQLLF